MTNKVFKIFLIILFFYPNILLANTEYFEEGLSLFKNKKFNEAKFKFEQDIVFNPKSEMSYFSLEIVSSLYLVYIFY